MPRRRSKAIATPAAATGPRELPPRRVKDEGRTSDRPARRPFARLARQDDSTAHPSTTTTIPAKPVARTATLTETPGWISARRAIPNGVSGERPSATSHRDDRATDRHDGGPTQREQGELPAVHPERGERGLVLGIGQEVTAERWAEHEHAGGGRQPGEGPEGDRLEVERPPGRARRVTDVGADVRLTVARGDDPTHPALEGVQISEAVPQPDAVALHARQGLGDGAEVPGEALEEGGSQVEAAHALVGGVTGDGDRRSSDGRRLPHDADEDEAVTGSGRGGRLRSAGGRHRVVLVGREGPHPDRAADVPVVLGRRGVVRHGLLLAGGIWQPPGDHERPVDGVEHLRVGRGERVHVAEGAAGAAGHHEDERRPARRGDLGEGQDPLADLQPLGHHRGVRRIAGCAPLIVT